MSTAVMTNARMEALVDAHIREHGLLRTDENRRVVRAQMEKTSPPVIAEHHAQIIYALQRAESSLRQQGDALCDGLDYNAEFFTEDADRMSDAIALVMRAAIPSSSHAPRTVTVQAPGIPHGVRCHNDACAGGQLQCPTPAACGVVVPHHPV